MNRMTADGTFLSQVYLCEINIVKAKFQILLKKNYFPSQYSEILSAFGYQHYINSRLSLQTHIKIYGIVSVLFILKSKVSENHNNLKFLTY